MFNLFKIAAYQREVALGLSALALLSLAMNFTGNWTLSGVIGALRHSSQADLSSSAFEIARQLEQTTSLEELTGRALEVGKTGPGPLRLLDRNLQTLARSSVNGDVFGDSLEFSALKSEFRGKPQLVGHYRYDRVSESGWGFYHCPVFVSGEWYVLVISNRTPLLARAEKAIGILVMLGALAVAFVALGVVILFRTLTKPYGRISEAVSTVVTSASDAEGAVSEIVRKYQETIDELQEKERKLVELNEQLLYRVTDVERLNGFLLGSMTTGVVILSGRGDLVGVNERGKDLLGLPERVRAGESGLGPPAAEDYVGMFADTPLLKTWVERVLLTGASEELEIDIRSCAGATRALRLSSIPLHNEQSGGSSGLREVALFVTDQSELVRSQQRLADGRRLAELGEMSAGLAHQLRNSLLACLGFGALARKKVTDADAQEALDSLFEELNDQSALVDRFLSFARPLQVFPVRMELAEMIEETLSTYQSRGRDARRVTISCSGAGEVEVDTLLLKQALVNLVDNALEASSEVGENVRLSVSVDEQTLIFRVSDDGPGVPAELAERVFTPFWSGTAEGAGLGLSLARKMIELHGGALELDQGADSGATFVIRMPRFQDKPAEVTAYGSGDEERNL
ncbi:MAG: PAS domain-containing sensor histidine kinase [Candidatus Zixiibacteriota bacterium]